MDRETIKKAALNYVEQHYPTNHPFKEHDVNVFMQGALYCINAIWHDTSEKPKFKGKVYESSFLVLRKSGECGFIQVGKDDWEDVLELTRFIKWADVTDLLPDGKEVRP